ncbi:hypothetical protein O0L34_g10318 [Tuta absoluta]|nr:hypothetical protein O0L34_g10318 [Tuta absoluta]
MIPKGNSVYENEENNVFGSRKTYFMLLLYRTLGLSNTLIIPQIALKRGAVGNIIASNITYIVLGIPIAYMELLISQFTGRDCIDMWKIRPCLSHIGYFVQFWQLITFIYNHAIVSILLHYFIISFENPPRYTECGHWGSNSCNIIKANYTAYHRCVTSSDAEDECTDLFLTYPEYQYNTYIMPGGRNHKFNIQWAITVTSFAAVVIVFFNCFKRIHSIKWFILPITVYPMVGYMLLLTGSMRQKGVISHYASMMDTEFEDFMVKFNPSSVILYTLYSTGAGTGVLSNIASFGTFRSPCFSNSVTAVLTSAVFTTIAIATSAMMACPYAVEYGYNVDSILDHPVSFSFVMMPRMISIYSHRNTWLILSFSSSLVLGISSNIVLFYTFLEITAKRNPRIGKYSELFSFIAMSSIFILTIPTFGAFGRDIYSMFFRRCLISVPLFVAILEIIVFIFWYGCNRFFEDIHFMQGIHPNNFMKVVWVISPVILSYVFFMDFHKLVTSPVSNYFGLTVMLVMLVVPLLIFLLKLLVAAFQRRFLHELQLDPTWGPQDVILRRSRTMFTAHAMTKEYMYRQYHLQAGVVARQKLSNTRKTELRFNVSL